MGMKQHSIASKRMRARRRKRRRILFGLVSVCLIAVFAIIYIVLYRYVSETVDDKICQNVYIGNMDVSGMTEQEAKKALDNHIDKDKASVVTMKVGKKSAEATLEELGLTYEDKKSVAARAYNYGKKGSLWKRYRQLKNLEKEKAVISEELTLDNKKAAKALTEHAWSLTEHAVNAGITDKDGELEITKEKKGKTLDIDACIKKIDQHLNDGWNHESFSMKMAVKEEHPTVTSKDLKAVKDELGTFSTDAGMESARLTNIEVGLECIDGTVLMPGEQFSMNEKTEPFDAEHGYVEAGSYENGEVVDTYGGGICQVSTTLYNAVLYAELSVVERYPHSMLVDYVKPSRDAAIAEDILDFVFENNYDAPVYISAGIDSSNQVKITIYGKESRDPGRTVEYESETLETEDYGTSYAENPELPLGTVQNTGNAHTGLKAQLWKIVHQDGEEVSRDVINYSNYEKSDVIVEIGTQTENAGAASIVRNAIGSQDISVIQQAINDAYALF